MKNNYLLSLIILFLFSSTLIDAQNLLNQGNRWNVVERNGLTINVTSQSVRINGDTIIDGLVYAKIQYSNDSLNLEWLEGNTYLREDEFQKIYRKQDNEEEVVIFDFSLEVGAIFHYDENCFVEVEQVDSIQLNNGEYRKRLTLKSPNGLPSYWIEGIGGFEGILIPEAYHCWIDYNQELLCFYQDGELLYPENPSSCFMKTTSLIETNSQLEVNLFPNPFQNTLVLKLDENQGNIKDIKMYTSQGRLIKHVKGLKSFKQELNVSDFKSGVYVLTVETNTGYMISKKVVKY